MDSSQLSTKANALHLYNVLNAIKIENITGYIDEGTNITIAGSGTLGDPYIINAGAYAGTVTSIGEAYGNGNALAVSPSSITSSGTFTHTWQGTDDQYVRGDGTLETFPTDVNFFNTNLTQTGDRNHSGAGYTTVITGNTAFNIYATNGDYTSSITQSSSAAQIAANNTNTGTSAYNKVYQDGLYEMYSSTGVFTMNAPPYNSSGNLRALMYDSVTNRIYRVAPSAGTTYTAAQGTSIVSDKIMIGGPTGILDSVATIRTLGHYTRFYGHGSNPNAGRLSLFANEDLTWTTNTAQPDGNGYNAFSAALKNTFNANQNFESGAINAAGLFVAQVASTASSTLTVDPSDNGGIRTYSAIAGYVGFLPNSNTATISHVAGIEIFPLQPPSAATSASTLATVTNYYGLLLNNSNEYNNITVTNRWGIYQEGAGDKNFFGGKVELNNVAQDNTNTKILTIDANDEIEWRDVSTIASGGGGEANTASNLGGGLANYDSKSGVDLRFNSFNSTDFDLASNLISIDATLKSNWNSAFSWGNHASAGYLTDIPTLQQVTDEGNTTTNDIEVNNNANAARGIFVSNASTGASATSEVNVLSGAGISLKAWGANTSKPLYTGLYAVDNEVLEFESAANAIQFIQTGTSWKFVLPSSNGTSGQVLQTDGSGNTSWGSGVNMVVIEDANYTVATGVTDVHIGSLSTTRTITLPTASSHTNRKITIKSPDEDGGLGNSVTISPSIWTDSSTSISSIGGGSDLNAWVTVVSDGTKWRVVAMGR